LEEVKLLSTTVMTSIGILVISFLLGFLFYFVITNKPNDIKKKEIDNVLSLLINFIIYIWIGKIIVNINVFFQDPLAILAYPSDAAAFYVATILIAVNIIYNIRKDKQNIKDLLNTFIPVFLAASFLFEFAQLVVYGSRQGWMLLTLLMVLLLIYISIQDKINQSKVNIGLVFAWLLGQFILSIITSYTTIFGYMVSSWFYISVGVLMLVFIMYSRKGKM